MKKKCLFSGLLLLLFSTSLQSQTVNHWETAIFDNDIWKYLIGTSEPDTNWRKLSFNDSGWLQGQGGIGYGDGDDNTVVATTVSLYLRKSFTIVDTSKIEQAVLNVDYDDAFVAYLNDVEIARANVGSVGDHPTFNQTSTGLHEAQMYQGGNPDQFLINVQLLKANLLPGNNVLSVQVHNENISSSDLTSRIFLSLGINDGSTNYSSTPNWFQPPFVFTSSNLPIVILNTNNQTILDNIRIVADMGIIYNPGGVRNYMTDPFNEYNGKISIELRGSSSQSFPKKSYSLETQDTLGNNNNIAIMDMPSENDWVLYAPYSDKSLIRNVFTYRFGEKLGGYTPRTKLCEVVLNNVYQGVYVFTEKIKRDKDRVDIAKLDLDDLAGDSLTGGYIIKIDKQTGGSGYDWSSPIAPPNASFQQINYQFHYPKQNDILPAQANYIETYITDFENALDGPNYTDPTLGYRNYIDVPSFIDFFIMNELTKNVDGFRLSTYMHKDKDSKGGKLTMGPLWDFNLALGNANYCDGSVTNSWGLDFNYVCSGDSWLNPFWWEKLGQDSTYNNQLRCRWENLRLNELHLDTVLNYIDTMAVYIDESQQRNFQKWPILGTYVWPNDYVGPTYASEINYLKNWITSRIVWIDNNIPGNCYNVGVDEHAFETLFEIYPNPANNYFNVSLNSFNEKYVTLYNGLGQVIYQVKTNDNKVFIDVSQQPNGIYMLEVIEEGISKTKKAIKY
ncbi:MAG: CotH kinase family protein [Flavobacteriales bacterium]|nr:CotH kinase family protein [Flavobacteriales bacterium]